MDPARIETLRQVDFPQADRADIFDECRRARGEVQDFYEKMLFIAGLYEEV